MEGEKQSSCFDMLWTRVHTPGLTSRAFEALEESFVATGAHIT